MTKLLQEVVTRASTTEGEESATSTTHLFAAAAAAVVAELQEEEEAQEEEDQLPIPRKLEPVDGSSDQKLSSSRHLENGELGPPAVCDGG